MLRFDRIELDPVPIKDISDFNRHHCKTYDLIFYDDEFPEEKIDEFKEKLKKQDFEHDDEIIMFTVTTNDFIDTTKILMEVSFFYPESEGDSIVPDIEAVEKTYRPIFEDFYKQNMPYNSKN